MKNPFFFQDDRDRLRSGLGRNTAMSWMDSHCSEIINTHDKIKHRQNLSSADLNLIDLVLNTVVCNIFHDRAERDFLLRRIGFEQDERESNLPG